MGDMKKMPKGDGNLPFLPAYILKTFQQKGHIDAGKSNPF